MGAGTGKAGGVGVAPARLAPGVHAQIAELADTDIMNIHTWTTPRVHRSLPHQAPVASGRWKGAILHEQAAGLKSSKEEDNLKVKVSGEVTSDTITVASLMLQ
jgi:hypothetical protein